MKHSLLFLTSLILCLTALSCTKADENPNPGPNPSGRILSINVTLPSGSVGKTVWSEDDRVNFTVLKGADRLSEVMAPKNSGESSATFEFSSFFPYDAENCYAYSVGEGSDGFSGNNSIRVKAFSKVAVGDRFPVTAGKADLSSKKMEMKAIYGQLVFTTETMGLSHVIFEGNGSEIVARDNIICLDDFSVKADPEADNSGSRSIHVEVSGPGTYCIPLFPGINLPSGYKLTVYGTDGKVAMNAKSDEALRVEAGKVYTAPTFKEGPAGNGCFDATKVVYSFGVLSDTHIDTGNGQNNQDKFAAALQQLNTQASKDDANGIDAICIAGDFTNTGYNNANNIAPEVNKLKQIYEAAFNPVEVPLIYAVGNHDPYGQWTGMGVYTQAKNIKNCFGADYATTDRETTMRDSYECRHCVVGDYHILCVTPYSNNPVSYPSQVTDWLDSTLKAITEADPERYVILLTHPMIYNTVYGSLLGPEWMFGQCTDYWYTKGLTSTLNKYPQVMTFSGHLHFPINDPRSIWQGDFTAFGCGSTRYMAIEDGKYENMSSTTVMKDASDISSGLLLQFDADGNARITKMFFSQNTTFGYPWEIAHPAADKSHLQTYNHETLKRNNTAPVLGSMQIEKSGTTYKAVFDAADDDEFAHHYVLTLKKDGVTIATKRILADFYRNAKSGQMKTRWEQSLGMLDKGNYEVTLVAEDSWGAQSTPLVSRIQSDDKRTWAINAKLFDPNGALGIGNTESYTTALTVTDHAGENGNNVLIKGLFLDAEVEGKIEYSGSKIKRLGIYLSSERFYKADASRYCVLLPSCSAKGSYWKDYTFFPSADKAFSDNNHDWLWFDVEASGTVARYKYYNAGQTSPNGKYTYLGLSFGWATQSAITSTAYDVIYQANYESSNDKGMWLDLPSE